MYDDGSHDDGSTTTLLDAATRLLVELTGREDARLRDGQAEAIEALVADRRRALVVQPADYVLFSAYLRNGCIPVENNKQSYYCADYAYHNQEYYYPLNRIRRRMLF